MCFGGGGGTAQRNILMYDQQQAAKELERLRAEEAERKANIKTGQGNIDRAFAKFDNNFFDRFRGAYQDNFVPELNDQHTRAVDKVTAGLAGRGMLESSVGANTFADMSKKLGTEKNMIAGQAAEGANQLRGKIEGAKTNLYSINQAAADPQAAAVRATGEASAFSAAPANFAPLGNVFGDFLAPFATAASAAANSRRGFTNPFATASGRGSSRVVT